MADLLVAKQMLKDYQSVDIAYVENVLKGESMQRTHTTATRTEGRVFTESETTEDDQHDFGVAGSF